MERLNLTKELDLSRIVQGFWRLTDWKYSKQELTTFIEVCLDRGVSSFDSAEIYADTESEKQLGEALKATPGLRNRMEIITKCGIYKTKVDGQVFGYYNTGYDRILQSCEESLKRLNCGYIDLYLIHREDPCINHAETARALKELKKRGWIREAGVSNFDPFKFDALDHYMEGTLCTNQIEWNPCCFDHFNSGMMDYLGKKSLHPMIWSPLAGGKIYTSDEPQYVKARAKIEYIAKQHNSTMDSIIYAWLLYHPTKPLPISGSNKLDRLDRAINGLEIQLEHSQWYDIYVASGQQVLR